MLTNSSSPSASLAPSAPGLVRVKSLIRANTMYRTMIGKHQSQKSSEFHYSSSRELSPQISSLETIAHPMCANYSTTPTSSPRMCPEQGFILCPRCKLVKYCSERCKKQHWPMHSSMCTHPYLEENWQPRWILQDRPPSFACASTSFSPSSFIFPAFDVLNLSQNEGEEVTDKHYKICFTACGDIRNLVNTVNNLSKDFQGKLDVLLNNSDPIITNRILVILYALLTPGPSFDKAAELAVHLMYSSVLSAPTATYLKCSDISFQVSLDTRGKGKIYSLQTVSGVKQPLEMFASTYGLVQALKDLRRVLNAPENADSWDRFLFKLRPSHRMAFKRFRETGVLAPFSADTSNFTQPNRLMFSAQGEWLGRSDSNPFQGWDIEPGFKSSMVESADIFGCLFFYLKSQFRQFAYQVQKLEINFIVTQFDPQILAKGISAGVIPIFEGACFDRIDTRDMMDNIGIEACLADWGPLLNQGNATASLLMHSRAWHNGRPYALARCNPRMALMMFMHKCLQIPGLKIKLESVFTQGLRSPALLRLIESLDAFYDHDNVFHELLVYEHANSAAAAVHLHLRPRHKIHPKRFGVPLTASEHQLPDVSKSKFYDLASLNEVDFSARFLEFGWNSG